MGFFLVLSIVFCQVFEEIGTFQQDGFVEIKGIRMQGGGISQA
jgi:hypothetical protein